MLALWIIAHFPEHRIYVEPFCGAASVLMRKKRAHGEIINDMDGEIVSLFRVLRDPVMAAELERLLRLTPFARDEFMLSYEPTDDAVERARRTVARAYMGFGSGSATCTYTGERNYAPTGFRAASKRSGNTPAEDWANYPKYVRQFTDRLRGVTIENRPAVEVIRQHDGEDTLFYCDPPYPHAQRSRCRTGHGIKEYRHEMTDDGHRELAAVLRDVQGMVVLSGYPCDLYDLELYPDWYRVTRSTHADGARDRTECLWVSPRAYAGIQQSMAFDADRLDAADTLVEAAA